jgi:predicted  nucleic acid-binding Zn-ribbon protein
MYTVFHSYKDDELIRYALSNIDHPAVIEICSRISTIEVELDEVSEMTSNAEDLEQAENTISDKDDEIYQLEEEISVLEDEVSVLKTKLQAIEDALA